MFLYSQGHWTEMKMKIYLEMLKVPKRENFELASFTLSYTIWVGD